MNMELIFHIHVQMSLRVFRLTATAHGYTPVTRLLVIWIYSRSWVVWRDVGYRNFIVVGLQERAAHDRGRYFAVSRLGEQG